MGKRAGISNGSTAEEVHVTEVPTKKPNMRKRKFAGNTKGLPKAVRNLPTMGTDQWNGNADDEDSSSNDISEQIPAKNLSCKHGNNTSIILNTSSLNASVCNELSHSVYDSPKPTYVLRPSMVNGTILSDLTQKPWRLGKPIGKGNFGEIFLASDNVTLPVSKDNAKYVVKVEPHSNGPLFVEIHCLMNTARKSFASSETVCTTTREQTIPEMAPSGIPDYIASGSHFFGDARYRFLVLQRFDRDLHSLIRNSRVTEKILLTLAVHIITVLENLHNKGYCHNDVKAQNLMISKCKFYKTKLSKTKTPKNSSKKAKVKLDFSNHYHFEEKQQTTDSGNSSEQDFNEDIDDKGFVIKRESKRRKKPIKDDDFEYDPRLNHDDDDDDDDDDEDDFDDCATTNSNNTNSMDSCETPVNRHSRRRGRNLVEYSGSNPVRSCRRQKPNSVYDEMVKSHYLRPTKRVSYTEFFNDDVTPLKEHNKVSEILASSSDESEEFIPKKKRNRSHRSTGSQTKSKNKENHNMKRNRSHGTTNEDSEPFYSEHEKQFVLAEEERIFLIDYGLASKYIDDGVHRPFIMDNRRAHDGTLEFTSRDAHMGAHSRRSDLECLGYNLIFWSQGYLPWKEAAQQQQHEKVHRAKEFLMTDVREMLKQIYGKEIPKYLGEFLHQIGQLHFHDRPNYERYRNLFKREYENLGFDSRDMTLDSEDILETSVKIGDEIENKCDIFELNKHNALAWSALKNCSVSTPYQETGSSTSRISPKNLRSKSDKKIIKKKKFSWAEILSQDPDQIARERAEKEFTREEESNDVQHRSVRRYEGKPTYAILEIQKRMVDRGKWIHHDEPRANIYDNVKQQSRSKEFNGDDSHEENTLDSEESVNSSNLEDAEEEVSENEQLLKDHDGDMLDDSYNEDSIDSVCSLKKRGRRRKQVRNETHETANNKRKKSVSSTTSIKGPNLTCIKKNKNVRFNTKARLNEQVCKTKGKSSGVSSGSSSSSSSSSTATISSTTASNQKYYNNKSSKRGCATKYNQKVSSSLEQSIKPANREFECHEDFQNVNEMKNNEKPLSQRRTRRCLLKTEKAMHNAVLVDEEDSNSNFSPDMRKLYLNNENMYYKSSLVAAAAANKHCKK